MTAAQSISEAERELLSGTLRRLAEELDSRELSSALEEFGFSDLLEAQPREAVSSLFDALGRAGSTCAAIQDVLLSPLAAVVGSETTDDSVVVPVGGKHIAGVRDGDVVSVRGIVLGARPAVNYLVPVAQGAEIVWTRVECSDLSARRVAGLDPTLALSEVTGEGVRAPLVLTGDTAVAVWDSVLTAGRRALGYQIVGAVGQMIDLAVAHATDRVQFGRPVGAFQAVRNRLADAHVARQAASSALDVSWYADDGVLAGLLAKSLAGRAARVAGAQCQQVLAGIGFTAEHPFHLFLARALVLDSLLGSAAELPAVIGARLIASGAVPRLVEL